jgi:lysophospholipase L1-like esterase
MLNDWPYDLHNVCEVIPQGGGWLLHRIPEEVRQLINPRAQERSSFSAGIEVRFVWDWDQPAEIRLESLGETMAIPFFGSFQGRPIPPVGQEPVSISMQPSPILRGTDLWALPPRPFSPRVGRLLLLGDPVILHGVSGPQMRRPVADEVPTLRYAAYGSSITHGVGASGPHLTYPARVGRAFGWDVINLGFRGSAYAEAGLADYLAEQPWEILTLEASVNMVSEFTAAEFGARWRYFIERTATSHPENPVIVLNMFYHFRDLPVVAWPKHDGRDAEEYRNQIRQNVQDLGLPNVSLLEHDQSLREEVGLISDLVHPADDGYEWIAHGLISHLEEKSGRVPCLKAYSREPHIAVSPPSIPESTHAC